MSTKTRWRLAALLLFALPATFDAAAAATSAQAGLYPARDMTMAQVRARFGAPERALPPDPATAGGALRPPIIRWIYPHFTVYFERNKVIHTVLTHPRRAPPIHTAGD